MAAAHKSAAELDSMWTSPTDHFKPKHKYLSLYTDHDYVVANWLGWKKWALSSSLLPAWTPLYFVFTWFSARNRNLFLVENNLNYRPYKWRRNDENNKY